MVEWGIQQDKHDMNFILTMLILQDFMTTVLISLFLMLGVVVIVMLRMVLRRRSQKFPMRFLGLMTSEMMELLLPDAPICGVSGRIPSAVLTLLIVSSDPSGLAAFPESVLFLGPQLMRPN